MFGNSTLFNFDFLDNINRLVKNEYDLLQTNMEIDDEIFNQSNCQCETERYEFIFDKKVKKDFQAGFKNIGYELVIVGLYKQCELHLKNVVTLEFRNISKTKINKYTSLRSELADYEAIDELRLINNSIKHQGKVSSSLAAAYSHWVVDTDLGDLSGIYERLKDKVRNYIIEHESHLKEESKKHK